MTSKPQTTPGASIDKASHGLDLRAGAVIELPQGQGLTLTEPVHSEARSRRWRATGPEGRCEVLFLLDGEDPGPLLAPGMDKGICGWDHARIERDGHTALVFAQDPLRPLASLIPRPDPEDEGAAEADRLARLRLALALGDLFEMIHELGEARVIHGALEAFAVRDAQESPVAVMRWPELLHPASSTPASGSFKGYGLDAPEVTGEIVRPVDQRADVFMLGMLVWALFSGHAPTAGIERIVERLPRLRAFDPDLPIGVDACVRRATSRLPEDRFESAPAFMDALKRAWASAQARRLDGPDQRPWMTFSSHTDIGRVKRQHHPVNQDSHLEIFDPTCGWGLFAVLDGVSRADVSAGELASWVARNTLEAQWHTRVNTPIYGRAFDGPNPYPGNLLTTMAIRAHEQIHGWIRLLLPEPSRTRLSTPCTTLSALGVFGDRAVVCTVGDSPIYLIRLDPGDDEGFIEQISVNQVGALENMRRGLGVTDALVVTNARWLSMALGRQQWRESRDADPPTVEQIPAPLECRLLEFRLQPGDMVLVTSDGIEGAFGQHPEREILRLLRDTLGVCPPGLIRSEAELSAAIRSLIREADERAGLDNMTAILLHVGPRRGDMDAMG